MDLTAILEELKTHRTQLDIAIRSLELMAAGQKRRGRPPKWVSEVNTSSEQPEPEPKRRGRPRKNNRAA